MKACADGSDVEKETEAEAGETRREDRDAGKGHGARRGDGGNGAVEPDWLRTRRGRGYTRKSMCANDFAVMRSFSGAVRGVRCTRHAKRP